MTDIDLDAIVRRQKYTPESAADLDRLLSREWLVTNGIGGYASGTVAGVVTRRYHGVLVAALPNPLGRMVMLNHLLEDVVLPSGARLSLSGEERPGGAVDVAGVSHLSEFRLEAGMPHWRYEIDGFVLERCVQMPYRQNTVHITWRLVTGEQPVRMHLRPALHFRGYEAPVDTALQPRYAFTLEEDHYTVTTDDARGLPPLRMRVVGADAVFHIDRARRGDVHYRVEEHRGYENEGALWTPGVFSFELAAEKPVTFVVSAESFDVMSALAPDAAWRAERERRRRMLVKAPPPAKAGVGAELVLAADQFIIQPAGRVVDRTRAMAVGDEVRTVIAGYHWFTDWGRDTMISLEGLTLSTGRRREAAFILRTFAQYVKDGLIPNMFPDGSNSGLYHTADATLWFFHAVHRFLRATDDRPTLAVLLPTLLDIAEHHVKGTHFGIGVDPEDGLLRQGADGYQLTWMDAKVDGWVVTPRRGKAVEINALWYNALCLLAGWVRETRGDWEAERWASLAKQVRESFNRRFWYERGGYLYDVVDGPDGDSTECRPNQVFAISLDNPVLDPGRWEPVMRTVEERLLTPVGLRSLAPGSPDYKAKYWGDLRTRDAANHQGTVWGWLIGPWVDAWLKLHPEDRTGARRFLDGLVAHLDEFGVGSIAEIFDADAPFTPRGCIAQAWSVAEVLRCWVRTAAEPAPPPRERADRPARRDTERRAVERA